MVSSLLEDRLGAIWASTSVGLFRYHPATQSIDRYQSDPANTTTLSHNWVWVVFEDETGRVWAGTRQGLNVFDRTAESFVAYRHDPNDSQSPSSDGIIDIAQLPGDSTHLWIGTEHGLNRFNTETGSANRYAEENSDLPSNTFYALVPDGEGYLWISTNKGLSRFDPRTEATGSSRRSSTGQPPIARPAERSTSVGSTASASSCPASSKTTPHRRP